MKILSNKEYYHLVNRVDILTRDNDCMNRKLDEMKKINLMIAKAMREVTFVTFASLAI